MRGISAGSWALEQEQGGAVLGRSKDDQSRARCCGCPQLTCHPFFVAPYRRCRARHATRSSAHAIPTFHIPYTWTVFTRPEKSPSNVISFQSNIALSLFVAPNKAGICSTVVLLTVPKTGHAAVRDKSQSGQSAQHQYIHWCVLDFSGRRGFPGQISSI